MIKLLIVDDESILRKGIITLIDWAELGCAITGECQNGFEAMDFLKQNAVDIVVTDIKMPGMDGLGLAKHIQQHYPDTKVIILTAYSDFSFAQAALKSSVQDYVIKTNFVEELPAAIKTLVKRIDLDKQISNKKMQPFSQNPEQVKEYILSNMLNRGFHDDNDIKKSFEHLGLKINYYFIIESEFDDDANHLEEYPKKAAAIKKFFNLAFNHYNHLSIWLDERSLISFVSFDSADENTNLQAVVMICNEILSVVNSNMSFLLNMGISAQHHLLSEIKLAYKEALSSLNRVFINNRIAVYKKDLLTTLDLFREGPDKQAPSVLIDYIYKKRPDLCKSYLIDVLNAYEKYYFDLEQIKTDWLIIVATCFREIAEWNYQSVNLDDLEKRTNRHILNCKSLNMLYKSLDTAFSHLCALSLLKQENKHYLVFGVNNYIKDHFHTHIKLEDIANSLHVNSSYLSRLYKKNVGDSIFTAINKFRIEKAKMLLEKSEYRIFEIALHVGIDDPAYFTKVFTQYVGVSPKNYKNK